VLPVWQRYSKRRVVADPLRVLVAGWLNSPHVTSWAEAVSAAGHDVHLAGRVLPEWPVAELESNVHPLAADGPPWVRSLRMSRALEEVAADVAPDLVHAHWLPELGWMAAREGLHPLVCSAWGSDVFGIRGIGRRRSKRALEGSQLVMADSVHLARATRELACVNVPVEVVRWGLNLELFAPGHKADARERLGIDHEGPLVVSVRGFDAIYNLELLLLAFVRVRRRWPDAHLLLKHPKMNVPASVSAEVRRLGLTDAVTMLGSMPVAQMPDVYRAADVVVSIASSDSSPRSVWEALACGRPVVVSDLPWARDELGPDRQAVVVALDPGAVAAAIGRLLEDSAFSRDLGDEARSLALAELDPSVCTARIDTLYRSVVESSG
jgi:glycosyltransferase involved in cell wall biosynthesis